MKKYRYIILLVFGLVLIAASISIHAFKSQASEGGCTSGKTCYFFVEFDWCEIQSSCSGNCSVYSYRCCHKQRGQCIYDELQGHLAYCDDFCIAG